MTNLDVLVGRWTVQPEVPGVPAAPVEFAWQDDGWFLRQRTEVGEIPADAPQAWRDNAPRATTLVIGYDDGAGEYTALYADARGVRRVYRMTLAGGVWRQWREAPGFSQRFTGHISAAGDRIDGQWERSSDGQTWELDFRLTYTRES